MPGALLDEALVVAAGHEADALRVALVGDGEPRLLGDAAHLRGLDEATERKEHVREAGLREAVEEVALVLGGVYALEQTIRGVA